MRLLLVLVLFVGCSFAANDTYYAQPGVYLRPPMVGSKLLLVNSFTYLDLTNMLFYADDMVFFSTESSQHTVNVSTNGYVSFTEDQEFFFSFDNVTNNCRQATGNPSLCPYMLQLRSGPWKWGNREVSGKTLWLTFETSGQYIDPYTGQPGNFMGAQETFTYICQGSCAALSPMVPRPQNVSYMVRRSSFNKADC